MIVIQGNGISGGMVEGPLYFYHKSEKYIEKRQVEDIAAEHIRVRVALKETADQLRCQADRRKKEIGEEAAAILEAHAMLAEDPSFLCTINTQIDELRCNAEYAVWLAGEKFADLFASMRDAYMQARAEDMRDVARRVCDHLMGMDEGVMDTDKPVILAVDDLLPSEFLRLDKKKILGFVMTGADTQKKGYKRYGTYGDYTQQSKGSRA